MAELFDLIESYNAERASVREIFAGDGTAVHEATAAPRYQKKLVEAVGFIKDVWSGRKPMYLLREAMSTSDFPLLFGDTIDRMMLAQYQEYPSNWERWLRRSTVADFRTVKRFKTSDGDQSLSIVGQGENYPAGEIDEASYSFSVSKYGRVMFLLWEALVNDDLDALRDIPQKMARAARRTEDKFASSLYVGNTTLYSTTHSVNGTNYSNKGTAALALAALETAVNTMAAYVDDANSDSIVEPIFNSPVRLVVPPQLELTAIKIVGNLQYIDTTEANALRGRMAVEVDPYIPVVDATNGATSWYLFADVANGHAAEVAFLRGYEAPQLFMGSPNAVMLGGGMPAPQAGDFDNDAVRYKVRHVMGGSHANAVGGWRYSYWSNGTS